MPDVASSIEPEYIAARTVLLDALEALEPHLRRRAVIVVGAQAVYLRTGSAGLTVAPFTTDGDLALDPTLLGDDPLLEAAMEERGFHLRVLRHGGIDPGTWMGLTEVAGQPYEVPVDLLVPEAVQSGGKARWGARLPVHGSRAAKKTYGLEAALVDQSPMPLHGLAAGDNRTVEVPVAGVGALLVAKVHKLAERVQENRRPQRIHAKDAGDVLRLIRVTAVDEMAATLRRLAGDQVAGEVTRKAIGSFSHLFRAPNAPGVALAVAAVDLDLPADQVEAQLTGYVRELRRLLG
jgi:hypothetical protein